MRSLPLVLGGSALLAAGCQILAGVEGFEFGDAAGGAGGSASTTASSPTTTSTGGSGPGGPGGSGGLGGSGGSGGSSGAGASGGAGGCEPGTGGGGEVADVSCAGKPFCAEWVDALADSETAAKACAFESRHFNQGFSAVDVSAGRVWATALVAGEFVWGSKTFSASSPTAPEGDSEAGDFFVATRSVDGALPDRAARVLYGDANSQVYSGVAAFGPQAVLTGAYLGEVKPDPPAFPKLPITSTDDLDSPLVPLHQTDFLVDFVSQSSESFTSESVWSSTAFGGTLNPAPLAHASTDLAKDAAQVFVAASFQGSFSYTDAVSKNPGFHLKHLCESLGSGKPEEIAKSRLNCEDGVLLALGAPSSVLAAQFLWMARVTGDAPNASSGDGRQVISVVAAGGQSVAFGGDYENKLRVYTGSTSELPAAQLPAALGSYDIFVARTSGTGAQGLPPEVAWVARLGSAGFDSITGIATTANHVVVTGVYTAPLTMYPAGAGAPLELGQPAGIGLFVAVYDAAGNPQLLEPLGSSASGVVARARIASAGGAAYVVGFTDGTVRNGSGELAKTEKADSFVLRLDLTPGQEKIAWVEPVGGAGNQFVSSAVFDAETSALYVAGAFEGALRVPGKGGSRTAVRGFDAFLARLSLEPSP